MYFTGLALSTGLARNSFFAISLYWQCSTVILSRACASHQNPPMWEPDALTCGHLPALPATLPIALTGVTAGWVIRPTAALIEDCNEQRAPSRARNSPLYRDL